jgi:DNA-binding FrmR family transcriptional regulator
MKHASHPEIIKRLKQASGHLTSVVAMIEGGRSCVDVAQQLQAVENAIHTAKRTLVQDHMEHCLADAVAEGEKSSNRAVTEFKTLAKYL